MFFFKASGYSNFNLILKVVFMSYDVVKNSNANKLRYKQASDIICIQKTIIVTWSCIILYEKKSIKRANGDFPWVCTRFEQTMHDDDAVLQPLKQISYTYKKLNWYMFYWSAETVVRSGKYGSGRTLFKWNIFRDITPVHSSIIFYDSPIFSQCPKYYKM